MTNSIESYSYDLPDSKIAQRPVHPYDAAKLLVINRKEETVRESVFCTLNELLRPGDLIILNNSKVIPARFFGKLGNGEVEVLTLSEKSSGVWLSIGKPLKRFKVGTKIVFSENLSATVVERIGSERVALSFSSSGSKSLRDEMESTGIMPIPPYIRDGIGDEEDKKDYQTFFGAKAGSVAAPTASLHFTPELIDSLKNKGVKFEYLTLHVGAASFLPLWHEHDQTLRKPGVESFWFDESLREKIAETRKEGGRVVAVGTTVVRALESMEFVERGGEGFRDTEIFITPGHRFKNFDVLITNFHQPRTTHLLLVEAFLGRELLAESYQFALSHDFRFLSYGDAMIVF